MTSTSLDRSIAPEESLDLPEARGVSQDGIHLIFGRTDLRRLSPILLEWMKTNSDGEIELLEACLEELIIARRLCRCVEMIRLITLLANHVGGPWPQRARKLQHHTQTLSQRILQATLHI